MNSYELSRKWFDFTFENPEKIKPNHTALYFFAIERCNRLGWKKKFGLPTEMAKEAIGIKSYNTYIKTFNDIVDWKFFELIEKSKNQYSSNIIALSKFNKALDKALDKALIKHTTKQSESTRQSIGESIDSINKQVNNKPLNKETINKIDRNPIVFFDFINNNIDSIFKKENKQDFLKRKENFRKEVFSNSEYKEKILQGFFDHWSESNSEKGKMRFELESVFSVKTRLKKWKSWENNFPQKEKTFHTNRPPKRKWE